MLFGLGEGREPSKKWIDRLASQIISLNEVLCGVASMEFTNLNSDGN